MDWESNVCFSFIAVDEFHVEKGEIIGTLMIFKWAQKWNLDIYL